MANHMNDKQIKAVIRNRLPGRYAAGEGLYLRLSAEGTSSWTVRYTIHGKRREITLELPYPALSLADARAETISIKAKVKKGEDPLAERAREKSVEYKTVDDLAADWLKGCEKRLKHPDIPKRVYSKDIAPSIGGLSLEHVNARDIRATIAKIAASKRPSIANDALMYCKQIFRHGIKLDVIQSNPADAFTLSDAGGIEKSRDRALSITELKALFKTCRTNSDKFTRDNYLAMALLVLLGVRKGELIAAQWSEFNFKKKSWNVPDDRSKTGSGFSVPLPDLAIQLLEELRVRASDSEFVFPNRRASKRFPHVSPDTLNAAIKKLFCKPPVFSATGF